MDSERLERKLQHFVKDFIHREELRDIDSFSISLSEEIVKKTDGKISDLDFAEDLSVSTNFFQLNDLERSKFLSKLEKRAKKEFGDIEIDDDIENQFTRIYIEGIDSFREVENISRNDVWQELDDPPLSVSEEEVKEAFREIMGEPFDQKDWPGETEDLFTSALEINNSRLDAAIMLKGPSAGEKMFISDAGGRGTQIQKLFEINADIHVIQFNGKIESRFLTHVKTVANANDANKICIIDGADTARILKAYGHL